MACCWATPGCRRGAASTVSCRPSMICVWSVEAPRHTLRGSPCGSHSRPAFGTSSLSGPRHAQSQESVMTLSAPPEQTLRGPLDAPRQPPSRRVARIAVTMGRGRWRQERSQLTGRCMLRRRERPPRPGDACAATTSRLRAARSSSSSSFSASSSSRSSADLAGRSNVGAATRTPIESLDRNDAERPLAVALFPNRKRGASCAKQGFAIVSVPGMMERL